MSKERLDSIAFEGTNPETGERELAMLGINVDAETGEILGIKQDTPFEVKDKDSAEWVLRRIQEARARVEASKGRLKAIQDNLGKEIRHYERVADFFEQAYKDGLAAVASENLEKGSKSWRTPYGTVSFRKRPLSLDVKSEGDLIRLLEDEMAYDAINVTKRISKSRVRALIEDGSLSVPSEVAEITGGEDEVVIK